VVSLCFVNSFYLFVEVASFNAKVVATIRSLEVQGIPTRHDFPPSSMPKQHPNMQNQQ
jgi:hypothetical protein